MFDITGRLLPLEVLHLLFDFLLGEMSGSFAEVEWVAVETEFFGFYLFEVDSEEEEDDGPDAAPNDGHVYAVSHVLIGESIQSKTSLHFLKSNNGLPRLSRDVRH